MKNFGFVLFFLLVDLVSKVLAYYFSPVLVFNKNLAFGVDLGFFVKMIFPILTLPILAFLFYKKMQDFDKKSLVGGLFFGGAMGNVISRFCPMGVIDFIPGPGGVFNLADVFINLSYVAFLCFSYKHFSLDKPMKTL